MGKFKLEPNSIFEIVFDRCKQAFDFGPAKSEDVECFEFANCVCRWSTEQDSISVFTPTSRKKHFLQDFAGLYAYLRREPVSSPGAGCLVVSRFVVASAADLAWIDVPRVAETFQLSVTPAQIAIASKNLEALARCESYGVLDLRHDGVTDIIRADPPEHGSVRMLTLFANHKERVVVGQSIDDYVRIPLRLPAYGSYDGRLSPGFRREVFAYEFALRGNSSFHFALA